MTFSIRKSGAWSTPASVKRRSGSAWAAIQTIKRRSGGVWVTVWSALSAAVSPSSGMVTTGLYSATLSTGSFTCSTSGASGPVSYAWQYVSGDTVVTCASPSAASTSFTCTVTQANPNRSAVWRCKATDDAGNVVYSNNITLSFATTYGA